MGLDPFPFFVPPPPLPLSLFVCVVCLCLSVLQNVLNHAAVSISLNLCRRAPLCAIHTVCRLACAGVYSRGSPILFTEAYNMGVSIGFPAAMFLSRMIVGAILPELLFRMVRALCDCTCA